MSSREMNYQLADLFCMYLKSVRCFFIPVCTRKVATSGARPYSCVTSGGPWPSTAAPYLASPEPCLGASSPAQCFTLHTLPSFLVGANGHV